NGPEVDPTREASKREGDRAGRGADRRAAERGEPRQLEDVPRALARPVPAGEPVDEVGAHKPFERVTGRDGEGGRHRARGGDVDEKSADQDGRPHLVAGEQEGREGEAGGGPHDGRARVDV